VSRIVPLGEASGNFQEAFSCPHPDYIRLQVYRLLERNINISDAILTLSLGETKSIRLSHFDSPATIHFSADALTDPSRLLGSKSGRHGTFGAN
jgi:hypothetical protein